MNNLHQQHKNDFQLSVAEPEWTLCEWCHDWTMLEELDLAPGDRI
jgi:hypothetical protein